MTSLKDTIAEREETHGNFTTHATISQRLKRVIQVEKNYNTLSFAQREALDMILHKVARILNGNPNHPDHWHDIAGYATLIEESLND